MKSIFLSYSWQDREIADDIDSDFKSIGQPLIRDVRDAPNYSSLSEFMRRIRQCDYAILLISDKYIKSENCMFEVLQLSLEKDFEQRFLPILLKDAERARVLEHQAEYIGFWEEKLSNALKTLKSIEPLNSIEQTKRVEKIRFISQGVGAFLSILTDKKSVEYAELKQIQYKPILEFIGEMNINEIEAILKIVDIEDNQERELALQKHSDIYGMSALYYNVKGNQCLFEGNNELAKYYYEKLLQMNSEIAVYHSNLAVALFGIDDNRAKEEFEIAIKLNPDFAEAYDDYANLLASDFFDDKNAAKKYHEKALELNPNNAVIHFNYANTLSMMDLHEEAEKEYLTTLKLDPSLNMAYYNIAFVYIELGNNEKAFSYFDKAIRSNSQKSDLYFEFATFLCQKTESEKNKAISKKNFYKAKEYFEKGLEIEPSDAELLVNYANVLLKCNEDNKIIRIIYEKALRIDPNSAGGHFNYALVLIVAFSEFLSAKTHLEKAIELEPHNHLFHEIYADLLNSDVYNDKTKAEEHYVIAQKLQETKISATAKEKDRNKLCPCGSGLKYKNCCGK